MREILFRAKAINRDKGEFRTKYKNGDWVYGLISRPYKDMFPTLPMEFRNENGVDGIEVDYKTVGQFTGLTDKHGKKIFESDILLKGIEKVVVKWNSNQCRWGIYSNGYEISGFNESTKDYFEIIGNVFDNPELLEKENA